MAKDSCILALREPSFSFRSHGRLGSVLMSSSGVRVTKQKLYREADAGWEDCRGEGADRGAGSSQRRRSESCQGSARGQAAGAPLVALPRCCASCVTCGGKSASPFRGVGGGAEGGKGTSRLNQSSGCLYVK